MSKVLVVFTAKGTEQILREGGSSAWALSAQSMRDCEFVICTRNTDPEKVNDFGDSNRVPHGAAFLVGKVAGLESIEVRNGRKRYRVIFSEFSEVNIPDFWDGSRVPTRYTDSKEVSQRGLDISALKFDRLVDVSNGLQVEQEAESGDLVNELTVADAKAGLAKTFGVGVEQIEIVIRT